MENTTTEQTKSLPQGIGGFTTTLTIFTILHLLIDSPFYFFPNTLFDSFLGQSILLGLIGIPISITAYILSIIGMFKIKKSFTTNQIKAYIILLSILINVILLLFTLNNENSILQINNIQM